MTKTPTRLYAWEPIARRFGITAVQASAVAAALGIADPVDATGEVYGDVVGALLGPLEVVGITGRELSPPALTADTNDWDPAGFDDALFVLVDLAGHALKGITAPDSPGRVHWCRAVTAGTLSHEAASSTDVNRLVIPGLADLPVAAGDAFCLIYLASIDRWQVIGGAGGSFSGIAEDLTTTETDPDKRLAPDGTGGVTWVAETEPTGFLTSRRGEGHAILTVPDAGAAYAIDCSLANIFDLTLTTNCTLTITNPPAAGVGGVITVILRQANAGAYTVTWPASVKWQATDGTGSGSAPTLYTAVGAQDDIELSTLDGGVTWGASRLTTDLGLTVEDEGSPLATAAATLNFVGGGVTASGTGATKTITIPGTTATSTGRLLLGSAHAAPIVFDDILQASDAADFLYASE